jgi:hypothetical protein
MYKNSLFAFGAKHLLKNRGSLKSYRKKSGKATGGSINNLDNYLLSLVKGVGRMSVKPKKPAKTTRGGALRFVR